MKFNNVSLVKLLPILVAVVISLPVQASQDNASQIIPIIAMLLLGNDESEPLIPATVFALVDATATKKDEVQLNWMPSSDAITPADEIEYTVYLSLNPAFQLDEAQLSEVVVGQDFITITGLSADTVYYAKVTATNADSEVAWSNELSFKTPLQDIAIKPAEVIEEISDMSALTITADQIQFPVSSNITAAQGSVLVSADPDMPFLRRVRSVETIGGETTVLTEQGSLVELFNSFEINSITRLESLEESAIQARQNASSVSKNLGASKTWQNGLTLADKMSAAQKVSYRSNSPTSTTTKSAVSTKNSPASSRVVSGDYLTFSIAEINTVSVGQVLESPITVTVFNDICVGGLRTFFGLERACDVGESVTPTLCSISTEITRTPTGVGTASSRPLLSSDGETLIWAPLAEDIGISDDPYEITITYQEGIEENNCESPGDVVSKNIKIYLEQGDQQINLQQDQLQESLEVNGQVQLALTNTVTTSFEPELTISAKKSSGLDLLESAELSVTGVLNLRQELSAQALINANVTAQKRIVEKSFIKVLTAGPVPILVRGTLTVDLVSTANASGEMSLTETLDDTFTITLGAVYDRDNGGWGPVNRNENLLSISLAGDASAELNLESRLAVGFELSFYEFASGVLIAEPYLFSDFGVQGSFNYVVEDGLVSNDRNYSLTRLDAGYGLDVALFAGLTVFDNTILAYPSGAQFNDPTSYERFSPIDRTPVLGLPDLSIEVEPSAINPNDSRALLLRASATNIPNPTPFGPRFVLPFSEWSELPSVIETSSECRGTSLANESNSDLFWFIPDVFGDCNIRIAGNSDLGRYARQTVETSYTIVDSDNNNIPDYWQERFNLTDLSLDSDNDGVIDSDEYTFATNPRLEDTDGDGSSDGDEIDFGSDPNNPNDTPNVAFISVSPASVIEGDTGESTLLQFNVSLDRFLGTTTVGYQTEDGTARVADGDFLTSQGTVSFIGGSTNETISVPVLGDSEVESNETLTLRLSNISGASFQGGVSELSVSGMILDDDSQSSNINDTGITFGGNFPSGNNTNCTGTSIAQQDCSNGRDATNNDDSDGHAGFSFTKLDQSGNDLPASADNWSCVRDNVTQLVWEVKTDSAGLHNANNTYTWYDTNPNTNGGASGVSNGGNCAGSECDTQSFKEAVNQVALCGYNDWRVPERIELTGIVNFNRSSPAIDTNFFPDLVSRFVWSASPNASVTSNAWGVVFSSGGTSTSGRSGDRSVRLVRGGQ